MRSFPPGWLRDEKKQGEVRSFSRVRANADILPLLLLLHYNAAIWRCACAAAPSGENRRIL
jgi:hypothetical protein